MKINKLIKFNQEARDVTPNKKYRVIKIYEGDDIIAYHFKDDNGDICVMRKLINTDTSEIFEVIEG